MKDAAHGNKVKRALAIVVLLCFVLFLGAPVLRLVQHSHQGCVGSHCQGCHHLHRAIRALCALAQWGTGAAMVFMALAPAGRLLGAWPASAHASPFAQKVKLNN